MFRRTRRSNPWPSAHQAEAHPTELTGPAENDKNGSNGEALEGYLEIQAYGAYI